MRNWKINVERLYEPFPEKDIEWRIQQSGTHDGKVWAKCLAYVTARAIQERLDEVFGTMGWEAHYVPYPKGVICTIKVQDDNGDWIEKSDGAQYTEIEDFKGAISGSLKRAAAAGLGIGRYLYKLDATFAKIYNNSQKQIPHRGKTKDGKWFRWAPPELPKWALPEGG